MTDVLTRRGQRVITKSLEWAYIYDLNDSVDGQPLPQDKWTYTIRLVKRDPQTGAVVLRRGVLAKDLQDATQAANFGRA